MIRRLLTLVAAALVIGLGVRAAHSTDSAVADDLEPDDLVVIAMPPLDPSTARQLGARLPTWEEAINAGTTRLSLPFGEALELRSEGFTLRVLGAAPQQELPPWPACYHRLADVYQWAESFAQEHADLVELFDIGDSFCKIAGGCVTPGGDTIPGADLWVARVTNERSVAKKQGRMWIDGGLHSREIPTVELMKATVEHLVSGYGHDPQITWLLDHFELHVGLASNPDGRQYVELGASEPYLDEPWLWRKNGNPGPEDAECRWPPSGGDQHGVDLNRNQAFKWDEEGHSTNPCASTYRGTAPASEPEIQAYEDYVRGIFPDQRPPEDDAAAALDTSGLMINFHNATYPGTVLVPWGWTTERAPNDEGLHAIGSRIAAFNGYNVQYALYPVSGNTRDWGYGELGIPAYVIELQGSGFITPCVELPRVIDQNLEAIVHALSLSDLPYVRVRGPEVSEATLTHVAPNTLRLTARATELRAGDDPVSAVTVTAHRPGGAPTTLQNLPLQPVDGAFDERSETVTLDLRLTNLAPGPLLLTFRAADTTPHWGPPHTLSLTVPPPTPTLYLPALSPRAN